MPLSNHITDVFFDLDRTLWDFEKNSKETLWELFYEYELPHYGIPDFEEFYKVYLRVNEECWELYRQDKISKKFLRSQRFYLTFQEFEIMNRSLSQRIGEEYIDKSPMKRSLIEGTLEVLDYLHANYKLHIITNGFEEVQFTKINNTGIRTFFDKIITSERAECRKPNPKIFQFATQLAKTKAENSIMIGDDFAIDAKGALNAGFAAGFWFEPSLEKEKELQDVIHIRELSELKSYL